MRIITTMMIETQAAGKTSTFKMRDTTLENLRMLCALAGTSMVSIVDALVWRELERKIQEKDGGLAEYPKGKEG